MPGHREQEQNDESFTLPAVHAIHLAEVVAAAGIAQEELFAPLGLDAAALGVPGARLAVPVAIRLFERARALSRNPGIGIQLGLQMRASAHGYLGFAAMTASNLREALETATRFVPTRTNALGLSLHVSGGAASLVIEERADFGTARDAIIFALAVGIWQIGEALTGRTLNGSADFAFARPPYMDLVTGVGPPMRFDQPLTQLVFDAVALDWPLTMSDPVSRQIAYNELERSLEELGTDHEILTRVRALVRRAGGGFHSLEDVASALHLSTRTLKRRLAAKGVTYSDLLEEQRREKAILLLRSPTLSLDQVAEQLGYSDPSNFRRAFRRWTGISPAAYRRSAANPGAEGASSPRLPGPEGSAPKDPGGRAGSTGAGSRRTPG
jgi:AraC-like DNA-binding protein